MVMQIKLIVVVVVVVVVVINFPPLKRGGLFERGGLIEDLR